MRSSLLIMRPLPDGRGSEMDVRNNNHSVRGEEVGVPLLLSSGHANGQKSFEDARILVVGLGRFGGGAGVTRWLVQQGANVTVTDLATADSLRQSLDDLADLPVTFHLGNHDLNDLEVADWVVVNPAIVKCTSPFFQEIQQRRIPWTTEMNLFCERCPAPVIGVTGTYGKSTTSAMLAHALAAYVGSDGSEPSDENMATFRVDDTPQTLLKSSGTRPLLDGRGSVDGATCTGIHFGGNIGRSLLTQLPNIRATDLVVLEMSNAQLEDLPRINWAPRVAVITNLYPHHLDRYDSAEDYFRAKLNIVGQGTRTGTLVLGEVHHTAKTIVEEKIEQMGLSDHVRTSVSSGSETPRGLKPVAHLQGGVAPAGLIVHHVSPPTEPITLRVPGKHNQLNAACVLAVADVLGLDTSLIRRMIAHFPGLPHRLEFIRMLDGITYINDSKATSPTATMTAVHSMQTPLVAIVGGKEKEQVDYTSCAKLLCDTCHTIICTGENSHRLAAAIEHFSILCSEPRALARADVPKHIHHSKNRWTNNENALNAKSQALTNAKAPSPKPQRPTLLIAPSLVDAVNQARQYANTRDTVLFSPGAPSFDAYVNYEQRGDHFRQIIMNLPPSGS